MSLDSSGVESAIRRFFINTIFDATFTVMGVISGSAFTGDVKTVLVTLFSSSIALGISSGVSVYEAETLEEEKRLEELEKALIVDLEGSRLERDVARKALRVASVILVTPLIPSTITSIPLFASFFGVIALRQAAFISIGLALSTLLVIGVLMATDGRRAKILKGLRMAFFGAIAFLIGYALESLL